jgi:pimeloyl-ACP methyl ester carboxylesterase
MLGHEKHGSGPHAIVVLNDWVGDTSTWDGARVYLDAVRFTWAFADLRGYGRSMDQRGEHTLEEAADDVVSLTDALGWKRFSIVGHSMSTLVALHLAQRLPDRIDRAVVLTPPPPAGFGADEERLEALRAVARGDDSKRMSSLQSRPGPRLSEGWYRFKTERWRARADPEAVAKYAEMFAQRGLPDRSTRIRCPVLAITGEQDIEPLRREAVTSFLTPVCEQLVVASLADCGHYPMQEAPPLLVALVERFLAGDTHATRSSRSGSS